MVEMFILSAVINVSNDSGRSNMSVIWDSKQVSYLAVWRLAKPPNLPNGLQEHNTRDPCRGEC